MKVNILGTEYDIIMDAEEKDYPKLKDAWGYTDFTIKKIVVSKFIKTSDTLENEEVFINKVLRHEIIHTFLIESGLNENSNWARNEEMVDWIALQFEKILSVFIETKAINK